MLRLKGHFRYIIVKLIARTTATHKILNGILVVGSYHPEISISNI